MKNWKWYFLIPVSGIWMTECSYGQINTPLSEAIRLQMVTLELRATGRLKGLNESSHIGRCISFRINNVGTSDLVVSIKPGYEFQPDSAGLQPLLLTEAAEWFILKKTYVTGYLNAMCSSLHRSSPVKDMAYVLGVRCQGIKLKFAEFVARKQYQNESAQSLLWVITDGGNPGNCLSGNSTMASDLRQFAAEYLGIGKLEISKISAPLLQFRRSKTHLNELALENVESPITVRSISHRIESRLQSPDTGVLSIRIQDTTGKEIQFRQTSTRLGPTALDHVFWVTSSEFSTDRMIIIYYSNSKEIYRKMVLVGRHPNPH